MAPLLGLIVFLGVYPKPVLDRIEPVGRPRSSTTSRSTADFAEPEAATVADVERRRPSRAGGVDRERRALAQARPGRRSSTLPDVDWSALAPLLVLIGGALLLLVVGGARRAQAARRARYALFTVVVAGGRWSGAPSRCGTRSATRAGPFTTVADAIGVDGFAVFFIVVICAAVVLGALLADGYLRREDLDGPELYVLMLLSASGGMIMASANDLIVMFLGLEILSIAVYVLAGHAPAPAPSRRKRRSSTSCSARSPRRSSSTASPSSTAPPARPTSPSIAAVPRRQRAAPTTALLLAGHRPAARRASASRSRPCRSTRGRPTCTRARPRPVAGVHGVGREGGRLRRPAAGLLSRRSTTYRARLAADRLRRWPCATLLVGLGARRRADRREAHAGLLVDQPRRLHPRRRAGGHATGASPASLFYLLAYTFMVAGQLRRRHPRRPARATPATPRRLPGPGHAPARCWPSRSPCSCWPRPGVPFTSGFLAKFYVIAAAVDADSLLRWPSSPWSSAVIAAFLYLRIIVAMYMGDDDDEADAAAGRRRSASRCRSAPRSPSPSPPPFTLVVGFLPRPARRPRRRRHPRRSTPPDP